MDFYQQNLERSVYEKLRLGVVAQGFTPDITTFPNTVAGYQQYQAALLVIKADKGFVLEIFNQSNPKDKGIKKVPRIVFTYNTITPGDWGNEPGTRAVLDGTTFKYVRNDLISSTLTLACHIIAETTTQLRTLTWLVDRYLPNLSYIPYYNDTTEDFLLDLVSVADLTDLSVGVIEKFYTYEIPDILINEDVETDKVTVPISEININTYISDHLGITFKIE